MSDDFSMRFDARHDFNQQMRPTVSARLVASSSMLELTGMALHEAIEMELAENPALEADEVTCCDVCGSPLQGSICPTCLRMQKSEAPRGDEEWIDSDPGSSDGTADGDFDPLLATADPETFAERMLRDLGSMIPREDRLIAAHLVGSLDERGYLEGSVEEIADTLAVDVSRVEAVLAALQTLEPVGVGARDLRECLLIQLDYLALRGINNPIARRLIDEHMSDLAARRAHRAARAIGASLADVEEAMRFVRDRLNPYPAQGHAGREAVTEARSAYMRPDVAIVEVDGSFVVEVVEARRLNLRLSDGYARMLKRGAEAEANGQAHVRQYASRARLFMQNVEQRRHTIKKVTEVIVREQAAFLRGGVHHLLPLTRSHVAELVELDESTVSRATNGKNVMLPTGEVVSFDTFFTPALAVHAVMRDILAVEGKAMTDQQITRALGARGVKVARRTVAKYRAAIGVLPSQLRSRVA